MRQSRRTEGTYQKPKKQTVAFASTKKADSTRLRFVTHLHPRFRLSCNHYTQENLFRKDKEKQKSNICSCFYFFLLHLPLQSCIYFFIQRCFLCLLFMFTNLFYRYCKYRSTNSFKLPTQISCPNSSPSVFNRTVLQPAAMPAFISFSPSPTM